MIEVAATRHNRLGGRIVIKHLPTGTRVTATRRSGIEPDLSAVVQLIQLTAASCNRFGGGIVIEHLPSGTRVSAAWRVGVTPNLTVLMHLIEVLCGRGA